MTDEELREDINTVAKWVRRFAEAAPRFASGARYDSDDHVQVMCLIFIGKQADHLKSLLLLGERPDTMLVARSMIEGLVQLKWAAQKPEDRALRWRAFAYVHDWRLAKERISRGEDVPPEELAKTHAGLAEYGHLFVKKKAAPGTKHPPISGDPYHKNWRCGTKIKEVSDDVHGSDLYEALYGPYSDWHHWDPVGLARVLFRKDGALRYSGSNLVGVAGAYRVATQCIYETLQLAIHVLPERGDDTAAKLCAEFRGWVRGQQND